MIVLAALVAELTLGPYHGPPLNGSVPGTAKFAVGIHGVPLQTVHVRAFGVPKGWIASFCTDRVCAPFRVTLTLPPSGLESIELQLIQNDEHARAPRNVTVKSSPGGSATAPFATATR